MPSMKGQRYGVRPYGDKFDGGKFLKECRLNIGITQQEVLSLIDERQGRTIPATRLCEIENGHRKPTAWVLKGLLEIYSVEQVVARRSSKDIDNLLKPFDNPILTLQEELDSI